MAFFESKIKVTDLGICGEDEKIRCKKRSYNL